MPIYKHKRTPPTPIQVLKFTGRLDDWMTDLINDPTADKEMKFYLDRAIQSLTMVHERMIKIEKP